MPPVFVRTPSGCQQIARFRLNFYGVKAEQPSARILMKQSQTNRIPEPFKGLDNIKLPMPGAPAEQYQARRLHFSETTNFNQRKNGKPNPDQKYFYLIAALEAITHRDEVYDVIKMASEKVIVRASNPGQFDNGESDINGGWQQQYGAAYHAGPVIISNGDPNWRPPMMGALNVNGDITHTGRLVHASDRRLKENIRTVETRDAYERLQRLRIVEYELKPEVAAEWGLSDEERRKFGVIAQELDEVIPDAVIKGGEYLQVDDTRIFYDTTAAVKELMNVNDQMRARVGEVERRHERILHLMKMKRLGSIRSIQTLPVDDRTSQATSGVFASSAYLSQSLGALHKESDNDKDDLIGGSASRRRTSYKTCAGTCHGHMGVCSNRWMQMTIIALVAVMAFW